MERSLSDTGITRKTRNRKSTSSRGRRRPLTHSDAAAEIVDQADSKPYQIIKDPSGRKQYVLLTTDHYDEFRDALYTLSALVADLDPNVKTVSFEEMVLRAAGADLAKARKAKGWTQAKLAAKTGVPQSQISRIERNPERTTIRTMKRLAKALGVDVRQLIKP